MTYFLGYEDSKAIFIVKWVMLVCGIAFVIVYGALYKIKLIESEFKNEKLRNRDANFSFLRGT
jgi:hypothetical protein